MCRHHAISSTWEQSPKKQLPPPFADGLGAAGLRHIPALRVVFAAVVRRS